jgi:alanine racemase
MTRRPCWVEIDTRSLEENYRELSARSGIELLAIVKADAYGHGLEFCAPAAVRAGARWLGVTSVEEGVVARSLVDKAGFPETSILVIAGVFPGQGTEVVSSRLTAVIWQRWQLEELETAARAAGCAAGSLAVHLEVDTGMSRQGVSVSGLEHLLECFLRDSPLRLDGLMTHLYAADESDHLVTEAQMATLEPMVAQVRKAGLQPVWLHVGNSAAVLDGDRLVDLSASAAKHGLRAMARPGLALYGLAPEFEPIEPAAVTAMRVRLRPMLQWKTRVVSVRAIDAGQSVGYNGTFVASEPMLLALLAVGYADGLRRELSNRGYVLVRGERAPIVGRISMDQTVVDVTGIDHVNPGDEVVLIGRQGEECIAAEDHAAWAGTIPWEIFTSISKRVERFVI